VYDSVRTVLFDFDGTLVFHEPDSNELISTFLEGIGQPLSKEDELEGRRTRHRYFVDPEIRGQLERFSPDQFWQHFNHHLLSAMGVEGDLDQLARELTAYATSAEFRYHCPSEGYQTLIELRSRGYQLGLITNRENVDRFYEILDLMELRRHFEVVLASGEIGISKPDPSIFQIALDRLGATAGQSIYVGDNYWADVVGAERAGITPVLLDPRGLFPQATCPVVTRIDELLAWLP
jgi:putative hydrolase of the HAD superfamily